MESIYPHLNAWFGLTTEANKLSFSQTSLRAVVVFVSALIMLRLAHKRFFAAKNAIDVLLTFVLASTLARAINGSAPFFPSILAGFVLVLLHRGITGLAARSHSIGKWVKGEAIVLVQDGRVDEERMRQHSISENDLLEDLRSQGGVPSAEGVKQATLERSGEISVLK